MTDVEGLLKVVQSSGSENDTDEKNGSNAPICQAYTSLQKPESVNGRNLQNLDQASSYTGKSFYACPSDQEQTKKLINRRQH